MSFPRYLLEDKHKPMLCPFCNNELIIGRQRKYETIADHVDDPNKEDYPLRETWVCICDKSKNSFWDDFGERYLTNFEPYQGSFSAINSGSWESERDNAIEDKIRKLPFGRIIIRIINNLSIIHYKLTCKIKGYEI